MPELLVDLLDTISRQDKLGLDPTREVGLSYELGDEPGAAEVGLPYAPWAAEIGRDMHATLAVWVRHIAEPGPEPEAEPDHLYRVSALGHHRGPVLGPWRPPRRREAWHRRWRLPAPAVDPDLGGWLNPRRPAARRDATGDTIELARWLGRHIETIRQDSAAGELFDEVTDAITRVRRAPDRLVMIYLGPCECDPCHCDNDQCGRPEHGPPADLYAVPGAEYVKCRRCGASYRVQARREWLIEEAKDRLLTAAEMSRALPGLLPTEPGEPPPTLTASMIRGWADRGRLAKRPPHPHEPRSPTYKVGDVLDVLDQVRAQHTADREARAHRVPKAAKKPEEADDTHEMAGVAC